VPEALLERWTLPEPVAYRGAAGTRHGLREPDDHPPLTDAVRG
jgi:hypothetical protein